MIFPTIEFQRRTRALQVEMAASGLDALLLTAPANVFYTTGFLTRFWESPIKVHCGSVTALTQVLDSVDPQCISGELDQLAKACLIAAYENSLIRS